MKTPDQVAALYAEQFRFDTDPRGGEVYPEVCKAIREAIEADRAQRAEPAIITTHDSRCTLDRLHDGECNVNEWRG